MSKEDVLKELYFDLDSGFGSVKSLYDQAKEKGLAISLNEVKEWVKKQSINQRRGYKNYNSYSAPYARAVYSIDIMDMISLMKDTDTYDESYKRYALVCIDNFSKKAHVVAMQNRDGETVYNAFMECFKVLGFPNSIYADDDGAFNYKKFQDFLKGEGIEHITTLTHANVATACAGSSKRFGVPQLL